MMLINKYPIFIVSKGRWNSRLTVKALDRMGAFYRVIVEEQEYDDYASVIDPSRLIILDKNYQNTYDTLDDLGTSKSVGPGAARNFAWDIAVKENTGSHWVMDDNIDAFHRLTNNKKIEIESLVFFRAMEDFCDRYENVAMAGPNYYSFAKSTDALPPFVTNTRIYSCNLIRNDIPFRWRGRYNEDTILSLDILKYGLCTIQFNAFLQGKVTTQRMAGGNNKDFYSIEGTLPKSKMLVKAHPDCSKLVYKFHRWHHAVNYHIFKQTLKKKQNIEKNTYKLKLIKLN